MRLGDSTDSFVSKDVEGEEKERVDFALIAFSHPPKNSNGLLQWNQFIQTLFDSMVGLITVITITYYSQHQSLHNRMAII